MIYIIDKISVLLKIAQITLKVIFSNTFSRKIIAFHLFIFLKHIFFMRCNNEKFKARKSFKK